MKASVLSIYRFSRAQVNELDKNRQWSRALDGSDYLPGMVILSL
jgi:U4/U6.U5 tri-snRNP-associated protein 2